MKLYPAIVTMIHGDRMKTVETSEFQADCLAILDEIAKTGEEIVITNNGRPVSKLVPFRECPDSLFGISATSIEIRGDIVSPIDDGWNAQS